MVSAALWRPTAEAIDATNLTRFSHEFYPELDGSFSSLHAASVADVDRFWSSMWDFAQVIGEKGERSFVDADRLKDTRFFVGAKLSFAENLLGDPTTDTALIHADESGIQTQISRQDLHALVSRMQQALQNLGVVSGDVIAAWLPNNPEAIAWILPPNSIGAIFSSSSPDFGSQGVLDRFGQIRPKVLIGVSRYRYADSEYDCLQKLRELTAEIPSLKATVVMGDDADLSGIRNAVAHEQFLSGYEPAEMTFRRASFDEAGFILFSSGTTGKPKCIVHRAGGILLQHLKEHQLHGDIKPGDRVFYYTTLGWMMWNWLGTVLASGATAVLYDGSPLHPTPSVLWDLAAETGVTHFGTSARYISAIQKLGLEPGASHDLSNLRALLSTGSPLVHENFDYVYSSIKSDLHLASISGGTDLCACLVGGDPTSPVYAGEIQRPALGLDIDIVGDAAESLPAGEQGELVCKNAFPSMPLGFWEDEADERYDAAYFRRFEGIWHQGDFASWTEHGGVIIQGRSDATLNPGGVRIGTAEIYRQVEQVDEVVESIVVSQSWQSDARLVLFV
ncbi:MAG: acetoacetate--CoA ligase, partial [Acidimicrobiales bacterium]